LRKSLSIVLIAILILSGIQAVALTHNSSENEKERLYSKNIDLEFEQISFVESGKFLEVKLDDVITFLSDPGKPMIPKVVTRLELPFGAKDVEIEVIPKNLREQTISKHIRPSPIHLPLLEISNKVAIKEYKNEGIYESSDPYPASWFKYQVTSGMNEDFERVTNVAIHTYPIKYIPKDDKVIIADSAEIRISYIDPQIYPFSFDDEYDMVIIAPNKFSSTLDKFIAHKNSFGVKTFLKTTEEIYNEYSGVDPPEEIKYFIKDAIEKNNVKHVLLVGGLKSTLYAPPRDHTNYGVRGWYVPVRYHNFYDNPQHPLSYEKLHDPGVITDLYYSDIYKEGGVFNDWDPNGDGYIAAWGRESEGIENDTGLDMDPDVSLSRLACRSTTEVRNVANKIIKYEETKAADSWFKRVITISGDGFMDQLDLDFQWDTNGVPDGSYIIHAVSRNPDKQEGPPDSIRITLDRTQETNITFNHDDWERIDGYPAPPIAEIVSISEGNVLGNNDYYERIPEGKAYGNDFTDWADINYTDGILHIRGKTYDPKPYGYLTDIHVWIENEQTRQVVFNDWRYQSEMFYEGEWVVGEEVVKGGGGATYYMPDDFQIEHIWASNGKLTGQDDVINALSKGCGFAFFSGHGSPNVWADHYPGIPGNRGHGSVTGLAVTTLSAYRIYSPPFFRFPLFPMRQIKNTDKPPIVLIGGCHNSQFNVSMLLGFLDPFNKRNSWCHGAAVPECFSWYLVQMKNTGAIATIGNTGLGYGVPGNLTTIEGLDGGICIEFFKQYGIDYNEVGYGILGNVYTDTLRSYVQTFDMDFLDHAKSLTQWVLLGDPSLRIGGYS
jgi:hypothetical protein